MDQLTHTVRRSNWINIVRQCQDRLAGTTAKQWLAENDIAEKSYYYWLRKIRREVCGCTLGSDPCTQPRAFHRAGGNPARKENNQKRALGSDPIKSFSGRRISEDR